MSERKHREARRYEAAHIPEAIATHEAAYAALGEEWHRSVGLPELPEPERTHAERCARNRERGRQEMLAMRRLAECCAGAEQLDLERRDRRRERRHAQRPRVGRDAARDPYTRQR